MTIKDDGAGFDPGRPFRGKTGKRGLGLLGIKERAAFVYGTLTVKSEGGVGTEITGRIPPVVG